MGYEFDQMLLIETTKKIILDRTRKRSSNKLASLVLFVVVSLAPLPFGSVDPLPIITWCMALGFALSTSSLGRLDNRHFLIIAGIGIVVGAYLLVLHEQVAAKPLFAGPDTLWQAAADALGSPLPALVTMVRSQPILALGAPLAAALCLLLSFIVCVDRKRAHQLLYVIAWSGTAYALYGIAAFFIDPTSVLWMKKQAYFTVLTSTFTNRNTAAVYFGSCVVLWLLILLDRPGNHVPRNANLLLSILVRPTHDYSRRTIVEFAALLACVVAMCLTGSRAGALLSASVGAVVLSAFVWMAVEFSRKSLTMLATAAAAILVAFQLLGAGVIGRLSVEGLASGGRSEAYRSTLAIIRDHPWLGTGLGTFAWVYPSYRTDAWTSWGVWERAHSAPLEIASDMGLPLTGVVLAGWAGVFAVLCFGLWSRNRDQIIMVAALATASLGIMHSSIDFSMQIPGFSLVVFALVGAGLAQSFRSQRQARLLGKPDTRLPWQDCRYSSHRRSSRAQRQVVRADRDL